MKRTLLLDRTSPAYVEVMRRAGEALARPVDY
jgi:hypothetical protein